MLGYSFMQHAFFSGTIIAFICGWISTFVILRRTAFAAHALGHTSLTGAAGAVLIGVSGMTGQLFINIVAAIVIGLLGDKVKKNDLVIGVVLTFFLGLGAYFLFLYQNNYAGGVMSILFGNILAVSIDQITTLCWLTLVVVIILIICMRPLLFSSIDPVLAKSKNVPEKFLNITFFILLAITVSMGCQIVGALLIFVLMVVPGAISAQWCKQFYSLLITSICVAVATIWISLTLSFYVNLPTSFCITMILCLMYFIGLIKNHFSKRN